MPIRHSKVSAIADGANADIVRPSDWNADHVGICTELGATFPVSPVDGQLFTHSVTGRKILYEYDGANWQSIRSYGGMTVYVDSTGTDDLEHGTAAGTDAFATINYAISVVPPRYGGAVLIYVSAETYNEDLAVYCKTPIGNYKIYIVGTLTQLATDTLTSAIQGTGATRGSVTKAGAFTGYANKILYANSEYRIIDSVTSDVATIVGCWSATPSGTYVVYEWGTKITGSWSTLNQEQPQIVFEYIEFEGSTLDSYSNYGGQPIYEVCRFNGFVGVESSGTLAWLKECLLLAQAYYPRITDLAGLELLMCKIILTSGTLGFEVKTGAVLYISGGCVLESSGPTGTGLLCWGNGTVIFDPDMETSWGYAQIRGWTLGISAYLGGRVLNTTNIQYSGNTTNSTILITDAHSSVHVLGAAAGSDMPSYRSVWMQQVSPLWFKNWESKGTWTTSADGSPGFTAGWENGVLTTGATSGNTAYIYAPTGLGVYANVTGYYPQFRIRLHTVDARATTANEIWVGMFTNPTAPTTTEKHIGFKIINGDISATQGDGATNNTEDTTVNFAQYTGIDLYIRMIGTTVYYWTAIAGAAWGLRNTLTTNAPTGSLLKPTIFIKTTENVAKSLNIYPLGILLGNLETT
jgi:hypothetical protein